MSSIVLPRDPATGERRSVRGRKIYNQDVESYVLGNLSDTCDSLNIRKFFYPFF